MKEKFKYKKTYYIQHECVKCGIVKSFNLKNFIHHLDEHHSDLPKVEHSELITDLSFKISRFNITNERKLERKFIQKKKTSKKIKIEIQQKAKLDKEKELKEFKNSVFTALKDFKLNEKLIKQLNSIKTIDVLKKHIMKKLKKEHHAKLSQEGIDYIIEIKKRKLKDTKIKNHDKVVNSVMPIYTPMGNKR